MRKMRSGSMTMFSKPGVAAASAEAAAADPDALDGAGGDASNDGAGEGLGDGEAAAVKGRASVGAQERAVKAVRERLSRALALGMGLQDLVWESHVVLGQSQAETALLLNLSLGQVRQLHEAGRRELAERAPVAAVDFTARREEVAARLRATYEAACAGVDPRVLAVRLKSLDQLTRLDGLNLDRRGEEAPPGPPYEPPPAMGPSLLAAGLDQFGRQDAVALAREALARRLEED